MADALEDYMEGEVVEKSLNLITGRNTLFLL